jgi:hemoglobin
VVPSLGRLADAWHLRVMADRVVSHAFSKASTLSMSSALAAYWAEALRGPSTYSDFYGDETPLVKMHDGNGEHDEMDRRAIACLADVELAEERGLHKCCTTTSQGQPRQRCRLLPVR